ncbi:hypothetical protein CB1_051294002 [Camelus ferus]|nr:hypothetical protein CB1_051294002 [Camelus ferus]
MPRSRAPVGDRSQRALSDSSESGPSVRAVSVGFGRPLRSPILCFGPDCQLGTVLSGCKRIEKGKAEGPGLESRLSEEDEDEDKDSVAGSEELLSPSAVSLPLDCGAEAENWLQTEEFTT